MSFHEVRFPASLSFGATGGPVRKTEIVTLANGFEHRNSPWAHARRRYDAGLGMRSLADLEAVVAFFEARHGQLYGFRWKDWSDYKSCGVLDTPALDDQAIGEGNGETRVFRLKKIYRSGEASYERPVSKPVAGTVRVGIGSDVQREGIDFAVDTASGEVTFADPPPPGAAVTAGFEFDVPVRFDTDGIRVSVASFKAGEAPDVPVIEVRT